MISNECEIKNAFPEFIHHNEDDLFNEYVVLLLTIDIRES